MLSNDPALELNAERRIRMIATLAAATGSWGMAGGQALDMVSSGLALERDALETMHLKKTGALIRASAALGFYRKAFGS